MYNTYGDDVTDEDYMKPHFMKGYIKREDYLYISIGYLKYVRRWLTQETTCQMKIARTENKIMVILLHPSLKAKWPKHAAKT